MRCLKLALLAAGLFTVSGAQAADITLKCVMSKSKDGSTSEIWVVINQDKNEMSVDGDRGPLSVTNDYYTSRSRPVASFVNIYRLDRKTGDFVITGLYEGVQHAQRLGVCDKAEPPATKF